MKTMLGTAERRRQKAESRRPCAADGLLPTATRARGLTLIELLVSLTVLVIVVLALGQVDITRFRMEKQASDLAVGTSEVSMALADMMTRLEQADRVKLISSGDGTVGAGLANIQLRVPEPKTDCTSVNPPSCPVVCTGCGGSVPPSCCFEIPANYRWAQYKHTGTTIAFYDNTQTSCGSPSTFKSISGLTINFQDVATTPPPGGEPFPAGENAPDNNLLQVIVFGSGGSLTRQSGVTMRAGAYTNVNASTSSGWDTGTGLAPSGVSNPPDSC